MPDSLGDRMKAYEDAYRIAVVPRSPTIIRVDGKAFHSYTRGLPAFSEPFADAMNSTAIKLCNEVQTCVFAYVQSDEISLLLHPYKRFQTQAWFDGNLQKMASVAASIAAATFTLESGRLWTDGATPTHITIKPAYFDARVFVLPESEVGNYFLWRQQDATRNSIQMLARSLYSHRECDRKSGPELQEMCFQKGINWNDLPAQWKRGRGIVKERYFVAASEVHYRGIPVIEAGSAVKIHPGGDVERSRWVVENEIPIFNQFYISSFLATEEA